jgi:hypothetical protein
LWNGELRFAPENEFSVELQGAEQKFKKSTEPEK